MNLKTKVISARTAEEFETKLNEFSNRTSVDIIATQHSTCVASNVVIYTAVVYYKQIGLPKLDGGDKK